MNENVKTLIFVAVAAVAMGVGGAVNWYVPGANNEASVSTGPLFGDFTDPAAAKAMEIIEYDQDTATVHPFKVAQIKGRWSIPSHDDYPADAARQLAEAAANVIDAEKLSIASTDESSYEEFGVIDPDPKKLGAGATGVGKRGTIQDKSNKPLADLIIGKAYEGKPDLRYVRLPGQAPVYVVSIKTEKFSTKFEDWIEKDLLKLNAFDVKDVLINDYSIDELRGAIVPRSKINLGFDSKDSKWNLIELAEFKGGDFEPVELAADEELDTQKLNDMKTALDDLKIVDVRRKPEGLAADLKAGEDLASNQEAKQSLAMRGFLFGQVQGSNQMELFSNEGEVRCGLKDGVEYVLRFGRIAAGSSGGSDEKEEGAKKEGEESASEQATGENRYIMVTAQFNEDLLDKPELEAVPGEKAETENAEPADNKEESADAKDENKPDADKPEGEEKPADDKASKDEAGEKKAEPKAKDDKKVDDKAKAERERIEKENKRKQDEYDQKVTKGQERVKELSGRFADWYYVISDATYQKIHLGRDEIVKKKAPPAGEADKAKDKENVLSDELKTLPGKE